MQTEPLFTSRRRYRRVPCQLAVRVGLDNAPFMQLSATDISEGGVCIGSPSGLYEGAMVDLWVDAPGRPFYARGCVAYVRGDTQSAGIEFVFVSSRERCDVAHQVRRLAQAA